jgi:GNAT superfamily N-acetyltransferase
MSSVLEIREGDAAAFCAVPAHAYGRDSAYVAPLDSDLKRYLDERANPLFRLHGSRRFFVALRHRVPVGRIVAHVHRASNARHGWQRAFFGFFDCAPDPEAAAELLGRAEAFGRGEGCDELMGNFNLTAMQQVGVLTEGFAHAPYSDQHYNPPHIPGLLRDHGFEPVFPMGTFECDLERFDPGTLLGPRQKEMLRHSQLRWEDIDLRHFGRVCEGFRQALNDGFDANPMFVPVTSEEFLFQARDLSHVMDPAISVLVHDHEGPAGAIICIPDLNRLLRALGSHVGLTAPFHFIRFRMTRERAVLVFQSVARRWQNRGLNGAMLHRMTEALQRRGYRRLGITWIADSNGSSLRQMEKLGARPLHRLHLFRKPLVA